MIDFSQISISVEKPARVLLVHPGTRAPLICADGEQAYIDVVSEDSDRAQAAQRETYDRRVKVGKPSTSPAEDLEQTEISSIVASTTGWKLNFSLRKGGEPIDIPFTEENARQVYSSPGMAWIFAQVNAFRKDRANFV